jgi:hypothetical protein
VSDTTRLDQIASLGRLALLVRDADANRARGHVRLLVLVGVDVRRRQAMRVQRHLRDAQPPGRLPGAELELDGEAAERYLCSLVGANEEPCGRLEDLFWPSACLLPRCLSPSSVPSADGNLRSSGRQDAFAGILPGHTARAARSVIGRRQR